MHRYLITLALTLAVLLGFSGSADGQYVVHRPVVVAPVPVYGYYPAPVISYYQPPVVSYYQAPVVYPTVSQAFYSTPTVSYYTPAATAVYSAYSAPVVAAPVVAPGFVSTRSYYGYGVFRPRGVYTNYYYNPGVSYYGGYIWP